jgi:hypothetical protein
LQAFHGKKWEKFNSEKVASLAYARIQGRTSLIAHFQNSSLMNEDKRCRPILFQTEGPNAGDMVNQLVHRSAFDIISMSPLHQLKYNAYFLTDFLNIFSFILGY